jgi:hypothetical protein
MPHVGVSTVAVRIAGEEQGCVERKHREVDYGALAAPNGRTRLSPRRRSRLTAPVATNY